MHELRGPAIAIAGLVVVFMCILAGVLVVVGWTAFSIYALVKIIGEGSDEPNAAGVVLAVVFMLTTFIALLAGGIKVVGKAMEPAKRRDDDLAGEAPGF
jgi:hypothetical protein